MEATCEYVGCKRKKTRSGRCILHLDRKNASEAKEFDLSLQAEIKRMQEDATLDMIDLSEFRFPEPTYKFPSETRFKKAISFSGVVFEGKVDFSGIEFQGPATFDYAKFLGDATFDSAKFLEKATFESARFDGIATFSESEFSGEATFFQCRFTHGVEFQYAKFSGSAVFNYAQFSGFAWFIDTKFSGSSAFNYAQFSCITSFAGSEFSDNVLFGYAKFSDLVSFNNAKFSGAASFDYAKFSGPVNFDDAKFLGFATFLESEFLSDATFFQSEFSGDTSFHGLKVSSLMTFRATIFQTRNDQILFLPIKPYTRFDEIKVGPRGEVRFEGGVCMSRVSLHYTDTRRFSFLDVKWGRIDGRASIMEHGILKKQKEPTITPEHVHQIYVGLRRNLEHGAGRYPEAGDFFINEKEMRKLILQERRRWPPAENLPEWLILKIYGGLALYGESIMRPIFWSVLVVFTFWLLRAFFFRLQLTDAKSYLDFLMESMMAFFQMRSEPGVDILERLISVPILGSLFIALKRKFERR